MNNIDLISLRTLLSAFPCTGLPIDKIKKVLEFHAVVKAKEEEYEETRKRIFMSYGIENDEDFANSKEIEKVTREVELLDKEEAELPEGCLSEDEILTSCTNIKGINVLGVNTLVSALKI